MDDKYHEHTAPNRLVVTVLFIAMLPLLMALWALIGLFSMRSLGRVMADTGRNLQEYQW